MLSLTGILRNNARHLGERTAVVMGRDRVSYANLLRRALALEAGLLARGVRPGDRVAVMARHCVDYVALYFAAGKAGITLVPLSYWHRDAEQRHVLEDSAPVLVIAETEFESQLAPLLGSLGIRLELVPDATHEIDREATSWERLYGPAVDDAFVVDRSGSHPHMMIYTSGTTGVPKGALLGEARTVEGAYATAVALGLRSDDVYVDCLRTFHSGSWDHLKLFFLLGATVVFVRDFDEAAVVEAMERESVTVLLAAGPILQRLLDRFRQERPDLSSLRLLYGGAFDDGTGVSAAFLDAVRQQSPRLEFAACYGLTEAGPFVTVLPPAEVDRAPRSVGRPVPGNRVELLDDEGNEVAAGEPGEVCVHGPVFDGYHHAAAATAEAICPRGGLRTGDVAIEDEQGYLTIVDRKKDVIRTGAHNVFSAVVESCVQGFEGVAEVAVFATPDKVYGEVVSAAVVPTAKMCETLASTDAMQRFADALSAHVRTELAGYNAPKYVVALTQLPRNSNGKVLKRDLRDRFAQLDEWAEHGGHPDAESGAHLLAAVRAGRDGS
jgi:fatty-acyl-CoA synthase